MWPRLCFEEILHMGTSTTHSLTIDCVWAPIVKAMLVGDWSVLVLGDQSTICIHLWSGVSRCDRVVVDQLILSGVSRWDGWATLSRRAPPEPPEAKWEALQWAQWAVKRPQVSPPASCALIPLKVNENDQTWRILFHMPPYYRLNWKNSCKYHPTWTENITFCLILRPIFAHCHQISWSVAIFNKQGELVKTSLCSALIWWFFGLLGRCLYLIGAAGIYMKLSPGAH